MFKTVLTAIILCITEFLVIVIASPMADPAVVLRFLPKDVQTAAANHAKPSKSLQMAAHLLLIIFLLAMIGGIIYLGIDGVRSEYGFWKLTGRFLLLLYLMKAFDILVQDQWLVMTVGYYKKLYPETADCEGWKDRGFNKRNQTIRILIYPFLCMLTAAIFHLFRQHI